MTHDDLANAPTLENQSHNAVTRRLAQATVAAGAHVRIFEVTQQVYYHPLAVQYIGDASRRTSGKAESALVITDLRRPILDKPPAVPASFSESSTIEQRGDFSRFLRGPKPHLSVDMSLEEAGRTVMAFHFGRMLANEAGTIAGTDPEALHDMRVATRRLRAAFRVFRNSLGKATLEPYLDDVRWLAALLGAVRDLDVFLIWLNGYHKKAKRKHKAAVARIIAEREKARAEKRELLLEGLRAPRYASFKIAFAEFLALPPDSPQADPEVTLGQTLSGCACGEPQNSLAAQAASAIERQARRVRRTARKTSARDQEALHKLRIACKRLRYTAEFFESLFGDKLQKLIRTCLRVQDSLGMARDAMLHEEFLRQTLAHGTFTSTEREAISAMISELRRERRRQLKVFRKLWPKLRSRKFVPTTRQLVRSG